MTESLPNAQGTDGDGSVLVNQARVLRALKEVYTAQPVPTSERDTAIDEIIATSCLTASELHIISLMAAMAAQHANGR